MHAIFLYVVEGDTAFPKISTSLQKRLELSRDLRCGSSTNSSLKLFKRLSHTEVRRYQRRNSTPFSNNFCSSTKSSNYIYSVLEFSSFNKIKLYAMQESELNVQQPKNRYFCVTSFHSLLVLTTTMMLFLIYCSYLNSDDLVFRFLNSSLVLGRGHLMHSLSTSMIPSSHEPPPIILLWTPYFSEKGKWLPSPSVLNCAVSNCLITHDRHLLNTSAAIVFHWRDVKLSDLPLWRDPKQRWVLFNKESPPHTPSNILEKLAGKFNWTATYRKDSDIYSPYGWIERRQTQVQLTRPPSDRKLACWIVSNCNTPSKREKFATMLRKFIPIEVYGKCGRLRCPEQNNLDCYSALSGKYKFYLSFENSICKDYITEKLFKALRTDMVPVVLGGANYSEFLPPTSYIDALSFPGPQQLAEYLLELDKDEEKYLSYLAWKTDYEVIDGAFRWSCELCRKLHLKENKVRGDLRRWWFKDASCTTWFGLVNKNFSKNVR